MLRAHFFSSIFVLTLSSPALGQDWTLSASLSRAAALSDDSFGTTISVSADSILVGANSEAGETQGGAAYVFSGANWTNVARLAPDDAETNGAFGGSVSLDGGTAFVGTSRVERGAVYVFERDEQGAWVQKQRLSEGGSPTFGYRLAHRGGIALIAGPKDGADVGRVYVYTKSAEGWAETQALTASDAMYSDFFGLALSFDGALAAVAAPGNTLAQATRAGVYVFALANGVFTQEARLSIAGPPQIHFGDSVSLSGDTLLVGAPPGSGFANNGQAVVFVRSGGAWGIQQTLTLPNEESFGSAVCVQGDIAFVGARSGEQASIYAFERANGVWTQTKRIALPTMQYGTGSIAVSGGTLVVGHPNDGRTGGVQVFRNPSQDPVPEPPAMVPAGDGTAADAVTAGDAGGTGCSVAAGSGFSHSTLALFGAALLLLRRRRLASGARTGLHSRTCS